MASAARARADFANAERNYRQAREAVDKLYVKFYVDGTFHTPRPRIGPQGGQPRDPPLLRRVPSAAWRRPRAAGGRSRSQLPGRALEHRGGRQARRRWSPSSTRLGSCRSSPAKTPVTSKTCSKLAKCHDQIGYMLQQLGQKADVRGSPPPRLRRVPRPGCRGPQRPPMAPSPGAWAGKPREHDQSGRKQGGNEASVRAGARTTRSPAPPGSRESPATEMTWR